MVTRGRKTICWYLACILGSEPDACEAYARLRRDPRNSLLDGNGARAVSANREAPATGKGVMVGWRSTRRHMHQSSRSPQLHITDKGRGHVQLAHFVLRRKA